jgi:hypothetical protein
VAAAGKAILLLGKLDSSLLRLHRHIFVPLRDHLRAEGRVAAHFDVTCPQSGSRILKK